MSDIFDHAGNAGAYPLGMHHNPFVPEAPSKPANKRATCRECGREIVQANDGEWIHPDRQMMHVATPAPKPKYDPRLDGQDIPQEVYDAAMLVSNYFEQRCGRSHWEFMGLQPRNWK